MGYQKTGRLFSNLRLRRSPHRDVSSVEVLMNYHQSLKSEVEARSRSMLECVEMGKMLLAARNPASEEVKKKLK